MSRSRVTTRRSLANAIRACSRARLAEHEASAKRVLRGQDELVQPGQVGGAGDLGGHLDPVSAAGGGDHAAREPSANDAVVDQSLTLSKAVADEQRQPFTRADAEAIRVPTLFIIGADTPGALPSTSRALAAHVQGSRIEIIPNARHFMFEDDPMQYCAAVSGFLMG